MARLGVAWDEAAWTGFADSVATAVFLSSKMVTSTLLSLGKCMVTCVLKGTALYESAVAAWTRKEIGLTGGDTHASGRKTGLLPKLKFYVCKGVCAGVSAMPLAAIAVFLACLQ